MSKVLDSKRSAFKPATASGMDSQFASIEPLIKRSADPNSPPHAARSLCSTPIVADSPTSTFDSASDNQFPDSEHQSSTAQADQTSLQETPTLRSPFIAWRLKPSQLKNLSISFFALLLGIALWHWATLHNLNVYINFENVPSPSKVFLAFIEHLKTDVFYVHVGVSMRRILISYSLAVVVGVFLGLLMGRSAYVRAVIMPYIEIVRPIPAVAWIPLAILMWPTEEASIIYITYLGALFPIVINTMHGVEQTPEVLVRAAKSLGASRLNIFWHVVLPAALPSISAGLAIGMGVSWFSLLAGEIISGQYGIGYFTWNAYSLINYQDIVVGMLVIGFLGTLSTLLVRTLTAPFLRWQTKAR